MRNRFFGVCLAVAAVATSVTVLGQREQQSATPTQVNAHPPGYVDPRNPPKEDPNYKPPMTAWGEPDFGGAWNGVSDIIHYSIEDPEGDRDEHTKIGGQRPMTGRPIIDPADGYIPYKPWAKEFAKVLYENHRAATKPQYLDPVARGFQETFPRLSYGGADIIQQKGQMVFLYGNHHSFRVVYTDGRAQLPQNVKLWNGSSRGHWEGNTLVVNIDNQNDQGWLQIVGGFHSDEFKLVEHFTRVSDKHMVNIIDVIDPRVYTQTWKIRVDYRLGEEDEDWENAIWEGNKLGGLSQEFWGEAKMDPGVPHKEFK